MLVLDEDKTDYYARVRKVNGVATTRRRMGKESTHINLQHRNNTSKSWLAAGMKTLQVEDFVVLPTTRVLFNLWAIQATAFLASN